MDDAVKIDRLIDVMYELKDLCRELENPKNDIDIIIGTMIALIICSDIPNVTILPTSEQTNEIAQA